MKATRTLQVIPVVDTLTGSSLVRSVAPKDIDVCILFESKDDMTSFRQDKEECLPFKLCQACRHCRC